MSTRLAPWRCLILVYLHWNCMHVHLLIPICLFFSKTVQLQNPFRIKKTQKNTKKPVHYHTEMQNLTLATNSRSFNSFDRLLLFPVLVQWAQWSLKRVISGVQVTIIEGAGRPIECSGRNRQQRWHDLFYHSDCRCNTYRFCIPGNGPLTTKLKDYMGTSHWAGLVKITSKSPFQPIWPRAWFPPRPSK